MWVSFSSGVVWHWTTRAEGAEAVSRAWLTASMTGRTSGSKFQEIAHFIIPGVRYVVVLGVWS